MFGALYAAEGTPPDVLLEVAREFSPRIEVCGPREIVLDLSGLARLFGDARTIAAELRRTAADRGLRVRVAIAGTRTAARLLVHHRAGVTVIEPGAEAAALAPLPLALLAAWTLRFPTPNSRRVPRNVAAVGAADAGRVCGAAAGRGGRASRAGRGRVAAAGARRGSAAAGARRARGAVRAGARSRVADRRARAAVVRARPADGAALGASRAARPRRRRAARAAASGRRGARVSTSGRCSCRRRCAMRARCARWRCSISSRTRRRPPSIASSSPSIRRPARVVQFSLLTRPLPSPEQVSTLMARLAALMGEGRCGSPVAVDSWQPGAFAMKPFAPAMRTLHSRTTETPRHRGFQDEKSIDDDRLRVSVPRWPVE